MAEPYLYRKENIEDENGNVVDTATMRIPNPNYGRSETSGVTYGGRASGGVSGAARVSASRVRPDWTNAEYRGASKGGRVKQLIRSAAGRGAARNPVMRNNRYGF